MIDRPAPGESAWLIHVQITPASRHPESPEELRALVHSAGFVIAGETAVSRHAPDPRLLVGSGKAEEIREAVTQACASLVIISHSLSPAQQRNLEKILHCRVTDRTELILGIFAQRARSFEGKLQVELALLKHQSTRLVRGWTHLERQRGGIGLRGGPGETQLETDRRLIRTRMRQVTDTLKKVKAQRALGRKSRQRAAVPTIALVGYTNAGKSTLFNRLTGADTIEADQLFATLDPTLRRVILPETGPLVFADTVGFIRDLPPSLIDAFRATLEEVTEATLLLHVVDVSDPERQSHLTSVATVLKDIGADTVPQLLVYNKTDAGEPTSVIADQTPASVTARLFVSARDGTGINELSKAIAHALASRLSERVLTIQQQNPHEADLLARLYQLSAVISVEETSGNALRVVARLPLWHWQTLAPPSDKSDIIP